MFQRYEKCPKTGLQQLCIFPSTQEMNIPVHSPSLIRSKQDSSGAWPQWSGAVVFRHFAHRPAKKFRRPADNCPSACEHLPAGRTISKDRPSQFSLTRNKQTHPVIAAKRAKLTRLTHPHSSALIRTHQSISGKDYSGRKRVHPLSDNDAGPSRYQTQYHCPGNIYGSRSIPSILKKCH